LSLDANRPLVISDLKSSTRVHGQTLKKGEIFTKISTTYDPFEKDIAIVKIIYKVVTL
jgi:hypothetical protein